MKAKVILLLALFIVVVKVHAQQNMLNEVTINPTQIDVAQKESGRSIEVINATQIANAGFNTVDALLENVVGVNLNARGGFGVQTDVGIWGSTFSQVLIIIDNVRYNEPLTGHFNMYMPVAMSEIAQIEIIKGAASSAYGADAVGGIIHIKTNAYLAEKNTTEKVLSSTGSALLGENNLRLVDAQLVAHNERIYFSGSINKSASDGQQFLNPNYTTDTSFGRNYNTFFDINQYSLSAKYFLNHNTQIFAKAGLNTRDFNAKYFYTNSTYDQSVETVNTLWTQAHLLHQGKKSDNELSIAYKNTQDEFAFNPLFAINNHETKTVTLNAQQQRQLSHYIKIAFGSQAVLQNITSSDRGNHRNNTIGFYANALFHLGKKLNLTLSGRVDNNENYGLSFVPQASASYLLNDRMLLRANVGGASRAPDFTERYIATNLPSLSPGRNLGNPDLKVENSISTDIGFDYYKKNERLLSLSLFARQGNNLIDYILTNSNNITTANNLTPNEDYFYTQNVSEAQTMGIDLALSKRFKINSKTNLKLNGGYTYINTTTANDAPSKYISNHPIHNINAMLMLQARFYDINLQHNFRTRNVEDNLSIEGNIPSEYQVTNALLRIKPFKGKINFIGRVYNLFDKQYQEILGAPMPRRWFAFGVDWKM